MESFEKINYLLRPNKSVERKMVSEMLLGLSAISDLTTYQYIGFGSIYFADFSLFHKQLGISNMISIESNIDAQTRCEFNKPFKCIELKMGSSTTVLPNLDIERKNSIIWLDYDGIISDDVFSDISTVMTKLKTDSFFMLSINADRKALNKPLDDGVVDPETFLTGLLGVDRYPRKYLGKKITSKLYLDILYECIINQINLIIQRRNGMERTKVSFHQTIHFVYQDGIRMLTIGGFLFEAEKEQAKLEKMQTCELPFYRHSNDSFVIQCPMLSLKEIQELNSHLPCKPMDERTGTFEDAFLNNFHIDRKDINCYASLYRYFPNFAETLI